MVLFFRRNSLIRGDDWFCFSKLGRRKQMKNGVFQENETTPNAEIKYFPCRNLSQLAKSAVLESFQTYNTAKFKNNKYKNAQPWEGWAKAKRGFN
jgi:hypothetical protein